jgi:hypothetical protein
MMETPIATDYADAAVQSIYAGNERDHEGHHRPAPRVGIVRLLPYTRPMRTALAVVAMAVALVAIGGCAAEKQRTVKAERLSAARLDGKFQADDPLVMMLTPEQRAAMAKQGMLAKRRDRGSRRRRGPDVDAAALEAEEKSGMDAAGDVMMSVLSVSITLGMMAAPYLSSDDATVGARRGDCRRSLRGPLARVRRGPHQRRRTGRHLARAARVGRRLRLRRVGDAEGRPARPRPAARRACLSAPVATRCFDCWPDPSSTSEHRRFARHADPEREAVEAGAAVDVEPVRAVREEAVIGPARP